MTRQLKILIVEDEPFWHGQIKTVLLSELSSDGYSATIDIATTAEEAKKLIRKVGQELDGKREIPPYDLVSLDMHLAAPKETTGSSGSGLDVLGTIHNFNAAWMVSVLTGAERDKTIKDSLGDEAARKLQKELRSSIYKQSFPRDRLIVQEKPETSETELIENRLKDVCTLLKHSLAGQNVFNLIKVPCEVKKFETTDGNWFAKDSKDYKAAKKENKLKKKGRRLQDGQWFEDDISLRQTRFGCGSIITLKENEDIAVIAAALASPGKPISGNTLDGDHEAFEYEHSELAETKDKDFDADYAGSSGDWDTTQSEARQQYVAHKETIQKQLDSLSSDKQRQREILEEQVYALETEINKLRRRPTAVIQKGTRNLGQSKSRVIATLKESGQLELAQHLDNYLQRKGNSLCYEPPILVVWNT